MSAIAAIVLAGGNARRLNGVDKCWLDVAGSPILETVVAGVAGLAGNAADAPKTAVTAAAQSDAGRPGASAGVDIVVVGPHRDLATAVRWAREDPPGSGPVAAIRAGMSCLDGSGTALDSAARVLLLGGDMPFVAEGLARILTPGLADADIVLGQDGAGRDQYLLAAWRAGPLRRALRHAATGDSIRSLCRGMVIDRRRLSDRASLDCDTAEDLAQARQLAVRNPAAG